MNNPTEVVITSWVSIQGMSQTVNAMSPEGVTKFLEHLNLGVLRKMSEEFTSRNERVTSNNVEMDD